MLLRSLCALNEGARNSLEDISGLIERRSRETAVDVKTVPFSRLDNWVVDDKGGLKHSSGKFFSVEGVEAETGYGSFRRWTQPLINQPEIGYLGLLAKEFNGVLHFLMQMKIEPGNINHVQVSPTLQATRSNFRREHHGRKPFYLDRFEDAAPRDILVDQLQSEHGSRFLRKRNRNIVVMLDGDIELYQDFCWMTAGQIKALTLLDNKVNMSARSVFSLLNPGRFARPFDDTRALSAFGKALLLSAGTDHSVHSTDTLLSWLTGLKADCKLVVRPCPVNKMPEWRVSEDEIARRDGKYFKILGINVSIAGREVTSWCQPVIKAAQNYLCAFIVKEFHGVPHFLVQAKLECGNYDVIELAPTVQCFTDGGDDGGGENESGDPVPFFDYVRVTPPERILYDTLQSEEGGRFYHDQNRYMLVMAGGDLPEEIPEEFAWMSLKQVYTFLRFNNFVNVQARSLIAALPYV
ncbi:MAG: NDP-hexose 2,3-dehydratase family protein [Spirochaetaceae bacterium]|jgi:oxidase EvaA|nr:NDP-hexose 2,3-dehydratase family protein [Spirochaetaceae bacterium]